jgi:hypothetical protein
LRLAAYNNFTESFQHRTIARKKKCFIIKLKMLSTTLFNLLLLVSAGN